MGKYKSSFLKYRKNTKDVAISDIIFSGQVKFKKLAKSTLILNVAPSLIIFIFILNGYLGVWQGTILGSVIFVVSLLFNYPYIADLQEVTKYVETLANDDRTIEPDLSFINNLEELSGAIKKMNQTWRNKNEALKILLLEDEILINSLPNIVLMLDVDLNILQTNEAAKKIFGWNYKELLENIIKDPDIKELCKKTLETGLGLDYKYELSDLNTYHFNIRFEKFPINSPNKIALVLIFQNKTTERKTEKMLSDFVANASHEMKTPLASITGFIETLAELENDKESQAMFLNIMREQSERMNRLINDLLVLSVIEAGVSKKDYEFVSLNEILPDALLNVYKISEEKKINIITQVEAKTPKILGRKDDLLRIYDNLISNAIKYSPEGADVIIRIFTTENSIHKLPEYPENQYLICFSVQDFGEGIDEKYIPRLTERFFRVDKARSRNLGGTGLGLSIVKHIIDNHNGHFEIKSKLGEGSIFSVYFPIYPTEPIV